MLRRLTGRDKPRLRLAQSLGTFTSPEHEDISPLHVFFEVANEDRESVELLRAYVTPKDAGTFHVVLDGAWSLPCTPQPGEEVRFWTISYRVSAGRATGHSRLPISRAPRHKGPNLHQD